MHLGSQPHRGAARAPRDYAAPHNPLTRARQSSCAICGNWRRMSATVIAPHLVEQEDEARALRYLTTPAQQGIGEVELVQATNTTDPPRSRGGRRAQLLHDNAPESPRALDRTARLPFCAGELGEAVGATIYAEEPCIARQDERNDLWEPRNARTSHGLEQSPPPPPLLPWMRKWSQPTTFMERKSQSG